MLKNTLLFLLLPLSCFAQNSGKSCGVLEKINTLLQREHFSPKPADDSLSVYVFEKLMSELDQDKNIFLKTEYDVLSKYKLLLDNYLKDNDCSFFNEFITIYKKALERSKTAVERVKKLPFEYNSNDTIKFTKKVYPFYVKKEEVEKVYTKRLKYDILSEISNASKNFDSLQPYFDVLEKPAREKVVEAMLCKLDSKLNGDLEKEVRTSFYNAFCSYFDPHTSYFSYDMKSSFLSGLSPSNLSLGLYVTLNEKEELVVDEIVPGGPASEVSIIEKGDQILKVATDNGREFIVSCNSLESIAEVVFADTYKVITLSLRKKEGTPYEVKLEKKIMKAEDHAVFSYVVSKENTQLGYINIPSFYSDFDSNSVQGVTEDVAREIFKLKKEAIDGIIIDLQNNGGGSMEEAIRLCGMFIDSGPVSFLKDNKKRVKIIRDHNKGVYYSGPLILLVNGNSASASEFFAAVMQDYNRAILLGSNTLGKATMQQILPVDRKNKDFVKLTVEKFYRVTGKSHQQTGVIPDVRIPILYDGITSRENSFKTALKNDSIMVKERFVPYSKAIISKLLPDSQKRVNSNPHFIEIAEANKKIDTVFNSQKAPILMNFKSVFEDSHRVDATFAEVKALSEYKADFQINSTADGSDILKTDAFKKTINDYRIKELQVNAPVLEALNIIIDYKKMLED